MMLKHMMKMLQMFALKREKSFSGLHFLCVTVLLGTGMGKDRLKEERKKKKIRAERNGKDDKKIRDAEKDDAINQGCLVVLQKDIEKKKSE